MNLCYGLQGHSFVPKVTLNGHLKNWEKMFSWEGMLFQDEIVFLVFNIIQIHFLLENVVLNL